MAVDTDILASVPLTATGQVTAQNTSNLGRSRVRGIYVIPGATAGSLVFRNGGASGPVRMTLNTVASATDALYMELPSDGLLFSADVHITLTNVTSVTLFYTG